MPKCPWNGGASVIKLIRHKIEDFGSSLENDKSVVDETLNFIHSSLSQYEIRQEGIPALAKKIRETLAENIEDEQLYLPSIPTIVSWFENRVTGSPDESTAEETSSELLLDELSEEELVRLEYNKDILEEAYGNSTRARVLGELKINNTLITSFIYHVDGDEVTITNLDNMSEAIALEQDRLLQTVLTYLRSINTSEGVISKLKVSRVLLQGDKRRTLDKAYNLLTKPQSMYTRTNEYTGIVKDIQAYFGNNLLQPDLDVIIQKTHSTDKNEAQRALQYLDAYNAWIILSNFPAIVRMKFGDAITINDDVSDYDYNKYSLSNKGTKVYSSWRNTEEIWLNKEVNNVVQLLISTTPFYHNGIKLTDKYLKFNSFNYLIAKLKDLTYNPYFDDKLVFDNFKNEATDLDPNTKQVLYKVNSISELVALIRLNPLKYLPVLFDVIRRHPGGASKNLALNFSGDDLDIADSIYYGLVGGPTSLYNITTESNELNGINYFGHIAEVVDSIFSAKYLQYYLDENGDILVKLLNNYAIRALQNQIEYKINARNSRINVNFNALLNLYQFDHTFRNENEHLDTINFTIPLSENKNLKVFYKISNDTFTYYYNNTLVKPEQVYSSLEDADKRAIRNFIFKTIREDTESDAFKTGYMRAKGIDSFSANAVNNDLFQLSCSVLTNMYISNRLMNVDINEGHSESNKYLVTKKDINDRLDRLFGKSSDELTDEDRAKSTKKVETFPGRPSVDVRLEGDIKLISKSMTPKLVALTDIHAEMLDMNTSPQVRDGNGNAVSSQTLSRLYGSYKTQFILLNLLENSASKNLSIIHSKVFKGIYLAKEFMNRNDSQAKNLVDWNSSEMATASYIYDFLGRLNAKVSEGSDITSSDVFIIPSVNSDKGFIGRLHLDLNEEFDSLDPYIDFAVLEANANKPEVLRLYEELKRTNFTSMDKAIDFVAKKLNNYNIYDIISHIYNCFGPEGKPVRWVDIVTSKNGNLYLLQIISHELGDFYNKALAAVKEDLILVNKSIHNLSAFAEMQEYLKNYYKTKGLTIADNYILPVLDLKTFNEHVKILSDSNIEFCKGLTPEKFINKVTSIHNHLYPNNPIKIIDLVHYIVDKNTKELLPNTTAETLRERLNDINKLQDFFLAELEQLVSYLLEDNFSFLMEANSAISDQVEKYNKDWKDPTTKKLILAKVTIKSKGSAWSLNITSNLDLEKIRNTYGILAENFLDILDALRNKYGFEVLVETNDSLNKFNTLNYLFSLEWIASTVGAHYAHPSKMTPTRIGYYNVNDITAQEIINNPNKVYMFDALIQEDDNWFDTLDDDSTYEKNKEIIDKYIKLAKGKTLMIPNTTSLILKSKKTFDYLKKQIDLLQKNERLEDEAKRYTALHKRNVSYAATMHEFMLGALNGIPTDYNIAIMSDITDILQNISGIIDRGVKPYDGATFVNPFIVYLENNSLGGARAGVVKKLFVHYYDERTGTGGIIKTAGFGLTNDWIRTSKFYQIMMKNMTDRKWRNEDGTLYINNVLEDYQGKPIKLHNENDSTTGLFKIAMPVGLKYDEKTTTYPLDNVASIEGGHIKTPATGLSNIWEVVSITYKGDNTYERVRINDNDPNVKVTDVMKVDSNYALWHLFGGAWVVDEDAENHTYVPSEWSIKAVVNCMNKVGVKKSNDIRTLDDIYQVLKHSDIHYMPTAGAVKLGAGNINGNEWYSLVDGDNEQYLNFMKIHMYQAGIQLDKEHHADAEEVSLMTLVISSCISRGYTFDKASKLYQGLASLARLGVEQEMDAFKEVLEATDNSEEALENFTETVVDTIVDALVHDSRKGDLILKIANKLIIAAKAGKTLTFKEKDILPYSDGSIYNRLSSILSTTITRAAIKLKIDGVLSMLVPSHGIMKLYGGKKLELWAPKELEAYQEQLPNLYETNVITDPEQITSGDYIILNVVTGERTVAKADDINKINALKSNVASRKHKIIKETFNSYNINLLTTYTITYDDGSKANLTLKTIHDYNLLKRQIARGKAQYDEKGNLMGYDTNNRVVAVKENVLVGRDLGHYNVFFQGGAQKGELNTYQLMDLSSVLKLFARRAEGDLSKEEEIALIREVQRDLSTITRGNGTLNVMNNNGDTITIDVYEKLDENPYELVLPKTFKTAYGLKEYDTLSEILEDPDFFTKKLIKNLGTKVDEENMYTLELKDLNGKHTYIADAETFNFKNPKITSKNIVVHDFSVFENVNGKRKKVHHYWRIDPRTGEKMYELGNKNDRVYSYTNSSGITSEIIVTTKDKLYDHYLNNSGIEYSTLHISDEHFIDAYNRIYNLENKSKLVHDYITLITEGEELTGDNINEAQQINANLKSGTVSELYNTGVYKYLNTLGKELHSSFLKALEIVAARIPAQSMLSFMPMRVVGFDNHDTNTAFVSTSLIWLQGSDYDIDAVTITNYSLNKNGKLIHWSPLASYHDIFTLKASDAFPFPTGQTIAETTKELAPGFDIKTINIWQREHINKKQEKYNSVDITYKEIPEAVTELTKLIEYANKYGLTGVTYNGKALTLDMTLELTKLIDRHNLYFTKSKNIKLLLGATKNFVLTLMYDIIASPINLIEAQTPVDKATDLVKEPINPKNNPDLKAIRLLAKAVPGNFMVNIRAIIENLTGKKGVGICAVGMKSFFALTLYYNAILNNPNTTAEEKLQLLLGADHQGITIGGKTYTTLANTYLANSDPYTIIDENGLVREHYTMEEILEKLQHAEDLDNATILNILKSVDNDHDAAIILSALLSLATDNAKELSLAKLNASTNMLGMYIYGVTLGMDFNDLAKIMMSPAAIEINRLMYGNSFNGENAMPIDSVFKYFENGPATRINRFVSLDKNDVTHSDLHMKAVINMKKRLIKLGLVKVLFFDADSNIIEDADKAASIEILPQTETDEAELLRQRQAIKLPSDQLLKTVRLPQMIVAVANAEIPYKAIFNTLNNTRNMNINLGIEDLALFDLCMDYIQLYKTVALSKEYIDLIKLADGADELKLAGQLLHINQGLESGVNDLLAYLDKLHNILKDRAKKYLTFCQRTGVELDEATKLEINEISNTEIDLTKLLQEPEEYIAMYDKIKSTYNLLGMLNYADQYKLYINSAILLDGEQSVISSKYRAVKYFGSRACEELNITLKKDKVKAFANIGNMVNNYIADNWMNSKRYNDNMRVDENKGKPLVFYIQPGELYFDSDGKLQLHEGQSPLMISLGTYHGKATFKRWMEQRVIPDLLEGNNGKGYMYSLEHNKFILDLDNNIFSRTPTHTNILSYTLPINMSPRTDEEIDLFNRYKNEFNKLSLENIGNYFVDDHKYDLQDLFFLYNLVSYFNAPGEQALTGLFSDVKDKGLIKDFYAYENYFDRNESLTDQNISMETVKLWATLKGSVYTTSMSQVWATAGETYSSILMELRVNNKLTEDMLDTLEQMSDETGLSIELLLNNGPKNLYGKNYDPSVKLSTVVTKDNYHLDFKNIDVNLAVNFNKLDNLTSDNMDKTMFIKVNKGYITEINVDKDTYKLNMGDLKLPLNDVIMSVLLPNSERFKILPDKLLLKSLYKDLKNPCKNPF